MSPCSEPAYEILYFSLRQIGSDAEENSRICSVINSVIDHNCCHDLNGFVGLIEADGCREMQSVKVCCGCGVTGVLQVCDFNPVGAIRSRLAKSQFLKTSENY